MAAGALFSVSEALILSSAEKGTLGRVMGLYASILGITFAVGPLIIPLTGIDGWLPWLIGTFGVALSALPFAFVKVSEAGFRDEGQGFFGFIRHQRTNADETIHQLGQMISFPVNPGNFKTHGSLTEILVSPNQIGSRC